MFLYHKWLGLGLNTRIAIATQFNITKSGSTHVADNRILSDGYEVAAVEEALNIDAVQKFTGSDSSDMAVLWDLLVERINNPLPKEADTAVVEKTVDKGDKPIKKRGRPSKKK